MLLIMLNERSYRAVIFDIEGTTTSISFVKVNFLKIFFQLVL